MSGVAMQRSKLIVPFETISTRSSAPTISAPAALASFRLGATSEHRNARRPARAVRKVADATDHLVGVLRIDAEVDGDFDRLIELRLGAFLDDLYGFVDIVGLARGQTLLDDEHALATGPARFLDLLSADLSFCHRTTPPLETHRTRTTRKRASGGVDVVGVHVLELDLCNLFELIDRDLTGNDAARLFRALTTLARRAQASGLLDEVRRRRLTHLEG